MYAYVQKLKNQNIFIRRMFIPDLSQLGFTNYKFLVYTFGINPTETQRLKNYLLRMPNIHQVVSTFGEWDYELNLACRHAVEVLKLREQLTSSFPEYIEKVEPLVHVKVHKRISFPGANFFQSLQKLKS